MTQKEENVRSQLLGQRLLDDLDALLPTLRQLPEHVVEPPHAVLRENPVLHEKHSSLPFTGQL